MCLYLADSINKKSDLFVAEKEPALLRPPQRGERTVVVAMCWSVCWRVMVRVVMCICSWYIVDKDNAAGSVRQEAASRTEEGAAAAGAPQVEQEGFKWSLKTFRKFLSDREGAAAAAKAFRDIDDVVVKTIVAAEPELTHSLHTGAHCCCVVVSTCTFHDTTPAAANYRTNCFELFGFDIFIDKHLHPHLVEVSRIGSLRMP